MLPTDPTQADKSIVALMHGIKTQESGGDYNKTGDKDAQGNYTAAGAGQWSNQVNGVPQPLKQGQIPTNFQNDAKTYGLNPNDFSPENQNKVIYSRIVDRKKKGYTPEQIASEWNSGDKDKYLNNATSSGTGHVGKYDVSAHVSNVMKYAQEFAQKNTQPNSQNPQTPTEQTTEQSKDWLSNASDIFTSLFGGGKVGEAIGAAKVKSDILSGNNGAQEFDYSKLTPEAKARLEAKGVPTTLQGQREETANQVETPTAGQIAGDVGQMALTVGSSAIGGEGLGLLGRLGLSTGIGAGLGATNAIANKKDIGSATLTGAGLGLAGGVVGETAGKLLKFLPKKLVASALGGADEATLGTMLEKPFTTLKGTLQETQNEIEQQGNKITQMLKAKNNPPPTSVLSHGAPSQDLFDLPTGAISSTPATGAGSDALTQTLNQFQDSQIYTKIPTGEKDITGSALKNLVKTVQSTVPEKAGLVQELADGSLTLADKNTLRQALDSATYDTRDPTSTFKKQVAKKLADALRGEIQSYLPESQPIFDELSKNINLRDALQTALDKGSKIKGIGLKDITAFLVGNSFGGIPGGLAVAGAGKILENPNADLLAARGLQGVGKVGSATNRLMKAPIISALGGAFSR